MKQWNASGISISVRCCWLFFSVFLVACIALVDGHAESPQTTQRVQTEVLRLFSRGFEPKEIERPAGTFCLAVINRTEIEDLALQLKKQSGDRLKDVRYKRTSFKWHGLLDLVPGQYIVTVQGHPEWTSTITITPN